MSTPSEPPPVSLVENPAPDDSWLARAEPEGVLDPDLAIVDAHHHLWELPWPYRAGAYLADAATGHRIIQSVVVEGGSFYRTDGPEALRSVGEVEAICAAADAVSGPLELAAAIIAAADLAMPRELDAVIDALLAAGKGRVRGIRYRVAAHPDAGYRGPAVEHPPGLLGAPVLKRALANLAERGLIFETWLLHEQLDELERLAAACPATIIVVDHLGGPLTVGRYRDRLLETERDWTDAMRRLAVRPNVRMKLGGLGMTALGARFRARPAPPTSIELEDAWGARILSAIDLFGHDRCMFESNFPVDRGQVGWIALWNAFKRISARLPQSQREDLFSGVARRTYNLEPSG